MKLPLAIAKFSHFEFWPWWLFYLPILPYWLFLAIKNRSLAYFTAANPGMELGGFYGESKGEILALIDPQFLPKAFLVKTKTDFHELIKQLSIFSINYPFIAKPDVGERGKQVALILSAEELDEYNNESNSAYLIQEFIDYEIELGVLFSRMPNEEAGEVTSITGKEFLSVTGDGILTIHELMNQDLRARFQLKRFFLELGEEMNSVLAKGETKLLEPIGNHCRGTKFLDFNDLINKELNVIFNQISKPIDGFFYGRYDLKVSSIEDLYLGKNIRILELNGVSSEPGHIYDPKNSMRKAYKDLASHWKRLAEISKENMKNGIKPVSFGVLVKAYWKFVVLKK